MKRPRTIQSLRLNPLRATIRPMGAPPAPQAETVALIAAMTMQPDQPRQNLIDQTIVNLKNAGLWTTFDFFLMFAAHDQQAARVGWINPARVVSAAGSPTFTVDRGYQGDGVDAYLSLGTNLNALVKFTQNNCSMGVWTQNNLAVNAALSLIGTTTTARLQITARTNSDLLQTRLLSASATTPMADSRGHAVVTRALAASYDAYKNGVFLATAAQTSLTLVAEDIVFLRNQANYSSGHILSLAHGGSSLTGAQIASLNSIIQTYMSGVGAA